MLGLRFAGFLWVAGDDSEERLGVAEWTSVHAETLTCELGAAFSSISYIKLEVGGRMS